MPPRPPLACRLHHCYAAYDARSHAAPAPALQSAQRIVGPGVAPSHPKALAGASRKDRPGCPARIRSRTATFAPATRARAASAIPRTPAHSFSTTILPRCCPPRPSPPGNRAACCAPSVSRASAGWPAFPPATISTVSRMTVAGPHPGGGSLGRAIHRTGRPRRHPTRPDLRESRRNDGRQQSPSALPDLGQRAAFPPRLPPSSASRRPGAPAMAAACSAITWRSSANPASAWSAKTNLSLRSCRFGRSGRSRPSSSPGAT